MTIGLRAHDFGMHENADRLGLHIEQTVHGPTFVHLAPARCIQDSPSPPDYDRNWAEHTKTALLKHHVSVAILGCHINPIHPDRQERGKELRKFSKALEVVRFLGTDMVCSETGSARADCSYTPETYEPRHFDELVESTGILVEVAAGYDAMVVYEGGQHTLNTFPRIERLLNLFPSDRLGLLFDPVNLVPPAGIPERDGSVRFKPTRDAQERYIRDALDRFADRIRLIHVKDYVMQENGLKSGGIPAGKGVLDWKLVFRLLGEYGVKAPMTLENCPPEDVAFSLAYLDSCRQ